MGRLDADEVQVRAMLVRVAWGDEAALEELHRLYGSAVFAFALSRARDREAAEEVAADTWLGCWRSAGAFRGECCVLTWLLGIAKRQAWTRMRRRCPQECTLDISAELIADDDPEPLEALVAAAGVSEILAALDALPDELAQTVQLAWLHELPYAEIAQVAGVPVGTVKSRVSRARILLKETLGRRI